jgi:signal transduction histidine kinase
MLHEFLTAKREEIIARTQTKAAARALPGAIEVKLRDGVPLFLGQLIETLQHSESTSEEMIASAAKHGSEMLSLGFPVDRVVHDYGDVCQAVTELAFELDAPITVDEFHTLNGFLDDAIAQAVTEYGRMREKSLSEQGSERAGRFAHEMRSKLSVTILAFSMLKSGEVPLRGSVGALLDRSLKSLNDLIDRLLLEVQLASVVSRRDTIVVSEFIEELELAIGKEARSRDLRLTVDPIESGIAIDGDRALLAATVANLLQNAVKFTPKHGRVRVRTHTSAGRVLIDIEDECGGLTPGEVEAVFRPFHQSETDGTGVGLALSISRLGVQLNGGDIRVRDVPGTGCVFTVDLPRSLSIVTPPLEQPRGAQKSVVPEATEQRQHELEQRCQNNGKPDEHDEHCRCHEQPFA